MKSGVYTITCLANNKIYVGSTTRLFCQRWGDHKAMLNKGNHANIHLQRAWNKYGEKAFLFEVLELCDKEFILSTEQYWINMLDSYSKGFNRNPNARNSYGIKRSAETCARIGQTGNYRKANAAWQGSKHSDEVRKVIKEKRAKQIMTPWSDERKEAHSKLMKGKNVGNISQSKYLNIVAEKGDEILRFANTHEAKLYFRLKKVTGITRVLRKERTMYMGYTWRVEMP